MNQLDIDRELNERVLHRRAICKRKAMTYTRGQRYEENIKIIDIWRYYLRQYWKYNSQITRWHNTLNDGMGKPTPRHTELCNAHIQDLQDHQDDARDAMKWYESLIDF